MSAGEPIHAIIGTAGHIDHGKTRLVEALTGVNTDRLKEEKDRGISIELGFAPLSIPGGPRVGIVDVPGHERFIRHMVAGVTGMDVAILVIAADEGVMAQTKEHLDVIELLRVPRGITVLTKTDLVDDEWLAMITDEVRRDLAGTRLAEAPILPVSAVNGTGIEEVKKALAALVEGLPRRPVAGPARLPVDRVFTVKGFGVVVTGTLASGALRVGDTLTLYPAERTVRIRGLQVHGEKVDAAWAGQRVAVNLAGVEVSHVGRGEVLAHAGFLRPSYRISVRLQALSREDRPLRDRERIRFHAGTKETLGRLSLLEGDRLEPGRSAFAQIVLEEPVVVAKGDPFVIRTYSPARTVGGGQVIDATAGKLKKNRPDGITHLTVLEQGDPAERLAHHLSCTGQPVTPAEAARLPGLLPDDVEQMIADIEAAPEGAATVREGALSTAALAPPPPPPVTLLAGEGIRYLAHGGQIGALERDLHRELDAYHRRYPLRRGMGKEELKSRLVPAWSAKAYSALLETWEKRGHIVVEAKTVALAQRKDKLPATLTRLLAALEGRFQQGGLQPPLLAEAKGWLVREGLSVENAEECLNHLLDRERLRKVGDDLIFHVDALEDFRRQIVHVLQGGREITVAEARDLTGSSRRYVVPLLEWLDRERVTRRAGDKRSLW
ncbi:selenocysteine-specific translation elongation factor [Heliobacterium gestii]|uniref:Selenocysteine-specific elongation factor n=1 Tax=Heliomicrobium gestii TaxID=2699 RepID=A0A845LGN8_HELGE|nr:selenocysteine-specific translation elongation factor [Heliomicrobium gestii]MBM7867757.1 selenocysteine-specific elongation factor [Heliomicrobium gestii]MZP44150.1 selenocysteine-specific translation elongation factor [Heliomicrobium gestii]